MHYVDKIRELEDSGLTVGMSYRSGWNKTARIYKFVANEATGETDIVDLYHVDERGEVFDLQADTRLFVLPVATDRYYVTGCGVDLDTGSKSFRDDLLALPYDLACDVREALRNEGYSLAPIAVWQVGRVVKVTTVNGHTTRHELPNALDARDLVNEVRESWRLTRGLFV